MAKAKALKPAQLIKLAEDAGWRTRRTGGGHTLCYSPDGLTVCTVASTPSDHRTMLNTIAAFRRGGLKIPH